MRTRAVVAVVTLGLALAVSAMVARAQSLAVDTTNPVAVTCATAGTNFVVTAGRSYLVTSAVEPVTWRIGTDGDGGTCAAGGSDLAVGDKMFVRGALLGQAVPAGTINGCCKSTGGTGTLKWNWARIETQ